MPASTVAILDVETDSLDATTGHLLEVGVVLWSVPHRCTLTERNWLVDAGIQTNAAQVVNGIPVEILTEGDPLAEVMTAVERCVEGVDMILAHNAAFDRKWLPSLRAPWVCTMDDLVWPIASQSHSLTAIALAHGVGVLDAHRALTDCRTIARLLTRVAETMDATDHGELNIDGQRAFDVWLEEGLTRAIEPRATYVVADSGFDPKRNELAKANGFRWVSESKQWRRTMRTNEVAQLPFEVREVQP